MISCKYNINILVLVMMFIVTILSFVCRASMADDEEDYNTFFSSDVSGREEMVEIAGYGEDKLSSVLVNGSIICNICSHSDEDDRNFRVSGALVTLKCSIKGQSKSVWAEEVTDKYGDFSIDVPSQLHATHNLDKTCLVTVLHIPKNSGCHPAYVNKQKGLKFLSVNNGVPTYSTGKIIFEHSTSKSSQPCIGISQAKKRVA